MALGSVEVGALVGFSGLISMIISKIKCYHKRPSCLCAYMDANDVVENETKHAWLFDLSNKTWHKTMCIN